jgi:hypothetical protein
MPRDTYLDSMLRHLGAAYYESLHGRATAADVARARAAIEQRLIWDIDGVVDVVEKLGTPAPASQ